MAYSARAVANAFIKRAKEGELKKLTPMKLQKLIFFAHSWYLHLNEEPLVYDFFARWDTGPIILSLYHELYVYGSNEVIDYCRSLKEFEDESYRQTPLIPREDQKVWTTIDRIIEIYGKYSGSQLASRSVADGSAWKETGGAGNGIISNEDMAKYIVNERKDNDKLE